MPMPRDHPDPAAPHRSNRNPQRNPDLNDRKVENNFSSAVARDKIEIAPVANVIHDSILFGLNSVTSPARAAIHANG